MTSIRTRLMIGIAALTIGASSLTAMAQDTSGTNGASGASGTAGSAATGMDPAQRAEKMRQRMEKRAAELKEKLKLNPSQEAAWSTYVSRMMPATPAQRPAQEELNQLTTPERMERHLARMKEHEAKMVERIAATKEFYAILTAEQKKTFDDHFKRSMHHGTHHGKHGHHHGS